MNVIVAVNYWLFITICLGMGLGYWSQVLLEGLAGWDMALDLPRDGLQNEAGFAYAEGE